MRALVFGLAALLSAGTAAAQDQFIYPNKGQSQAQQDKDKYECYGWAKNQSGFDPMAVPRASTPAPKGQERSVAGGAVGGAVGGAAIGSVAGLIGGGKKGLGKGAGMGAGVGGLMGGMSAAGDNEKASRERRDWERTEANKYAQNRNNYDRAFAACLEGRGYTVK
jgi:hypothetical protein